MLVVRAPLDWTVQTQVITSWTLTGETGAAPVESETTDQIQQSIINVINNRDVTQTV